MISANLEVIWAMSDECISCGRQTSVTARTILHRTKLPLTTWFWAAYDDCHQTWTTHMTRADQKQRERSILDLYIRCVGLSGAGLPPQHAS